MTDDTADERHVHDLYDDEVVEESRTVRPYALTRGRTRAGRGDLPLEALVRGVAGATDPTSTPEHRRIIELPVRSAISHRRSVRWSWRRRRSVPLARTKL